jgi:hypothetical protein
MSHRRIPAVGEEAMLVHRDGSYPVRVDDVFYLKSAPNYAPIIAVRVDCEDGDIQHFRLYAGPEDYPWERVVQTAVGRWIKKGPGVRFVGDATA